MFEVGQRVKVKESFWDGFSNLVGQEGVVYEKPDDGTILVLFDTWDRGHSQGGRCWWIVPSELEEI